MPRLAPVDLPTWADRAHEVIGRRPDLAVVTAMADHHSPMSHAEVMAAAGLTRQTVTTSLQRLEAAGIVQPDAPRPQRPGPGARWSLDRDALARVLHDLADGLTRLPAS